MIKKIVLFSILLFISVFLYSQRFYGGVLAGFNGSQVEGDRARGYHKMGFLGGTWIQTDLSELFFMGMELKFSQKGSQIIPTVRNNNWHYIYSLSYVDLPVLFGYKHKDFFSLFAGLSFNYLIDTWGIDNYGSDPTVYYSDVNDWELGMLAGVKVPFERMVNQPWARNFEVDVRFQYSVLSIYGNYNPFFNYNYEYCQFNNVLSFGLYYRINPVKRNSLF